MKHLILSMATLEKIVGKIPAGSPQYLNAESMLAGLDAGGFDAGLQAPHRLAKYLGQLIVESGGFRYDREIWGNTKAQKRYDTRTDLGNTPERDGDGYKYRGRTPIQITGKANTREYRDWCRKMISHTCPDFVADPDQMNTDPWEGLGPIWYWSTRKLNNFADTDDVRGITKRINGGYNHLAERIKWTDRASLVLLGFARDDVRGFQAAHSDELDVDGDIGPKTRAVMHKALMALKSPKKPLAARKIPGAGGKVGPGAAVGAGLGGLVAAWAIFQDKLADWVCAIPMIGNLCGG